jgi:hypothetical protein
MILDVGWNFLEGIGLRGSEDICEVVQLFVCEIASYTLHCCRDEEDEKQKSFHAIYRK